MSLTSSGSIPALTSSFQNLSLASPQAPRRVPLLAQVLPDPLFALVVSWLPNKHLDQILRLYPDAFSSATSRNLLGRRANDLASLAIKELFKNWNVRQTFPQHLQGFLTTKKTRVTSLNLNNLELANPDTISVLRQFPNVSSLSLAHTQIISPTHFRQILGCYPNLQNLNLTGCEDLPAEAISEIPLWCPHLRELHLSSCRQLTDQILGMIVTTCQELRSLVVQNCERLTDQAIIQIALHCPRLEILNLSHTNTLSDLFLNEDSFEVQCTHLRQLDLAGCRYLSTMTATTLLQHCPNLEWLKLGKTIQHLSPGVIEAIALYCKNLRYLDLTGCQDLSDVRIQEIVQRNCHLRTLILENCLYMSCETLPIIAKYGHELQSINLNGWFVLTDQALRELAAGCPNLREVLLMQCPSITEAGIIALATGCPHIETIYVQATEKLPKEAIVRLQKRFPKIINGN